MLFFRLEVTGNFEGGLLRANTCTVSAGNRKSPFATALASPEQAEQLDKALKLLKGERQRECSQGPSRIQPFAIRCLQHLTKEC